MLTISNYRDGRRRCWEPVTPSPSHNIYMFIVEMLSGDYSSCDGARAVSRMSDDERTFTQDKTSNTFTQDEIFTRVVVPVAREF